MVLDDTRFYGCESSLWVNLEDSVHMPGEIENHATGTNGLSPERRTGPSWEDRDVVVGRNSDSRNDVRGVRRIDNTGGARAIDTAIGSVEYLSVLIELNTAVYNVTKVRR